MQNDLQIKTLSGTLAREYLSEIAHLRITVFRDYPYLYEGTLSYEEKYLETYFRCPEARLMLCFDGKKLVGASTAIPLQHEDPSFQKPLIERGIDVSTVMYFGESMLLPKYRGRGIGKRFFEERLKHSLEHPGIRKAIFCTVIRPSNHPMKPKDYRPLDSLWTSFGFAPVEGLTCELEWQQMDETKPSPKTLQFWVREL